MMTNQNQLAGFAGARAAYRSCLLLRDPHDEPGFPLIGRSTEGRSRSRRIAIAFDQGLAVVLVATILVGSIVLASSLYAMF